MAKLRQVQSAAGTAPKTTPTEAPVANVGHSLFLQLLRNSDIKKETKKSAKAALEAQLGSMNKPGMPALYYYEDSEHGNAFRILLGICGNTSEHYEVFDSEEEAEKVVKAKIATLFTEDLVEDGKYVSAVSEADGIINVTKSTFGSGTAESTAIESGATPSTHIQVSVAYGKGEVSSVAVKEHDIASADALSALTEKVDAINVNGDIDKKLSGLTFSEIGSADNTYIKTVKQENGQLSATAQTLVNATDNILTYTADGITAKVGLKQLTPEEIKNLEGAANIREAYKLVDKNGDQVAETATIKVYKDQTLKEARVGKATPAGKGQEEDCLILTYILANGSESTVNIPLGDFLTQSEFKDGLKVNDGAVSVNLSEDAQSKKNFLKFEGTEAGKKTLAVRGMDTDKTTTTARIPVAGGPLADLVSKAGIKEFKPGDNIQDILMTLLCKETLPANPKRNVASISSKFDTLSSSLTSNGKTVETGTEITLGKVTTAAPKITTNSQTYSGFDNGYATELNGSVTKGNPAISAVTGATLTDETYKLAISGKINSTITGTTIDAINQHANNNSKTFNATDGDNSVTVTISGSKCSGNVGARPKYYVSSNLDKTYEAHPESIEGNSPTIVAAHEPYTVTGATASKSVTYKVTGKRYGFYGGQKAVGFTADSANIRALATKSFNPFTKITLGAGMKQIVIAFPTSWGTIKKVTDDNATNAVITTAYVEQPNVTVEGANSESGVSYKVYILKSDVAFKEISHTITIDK